MRDVLLNITLKVCLLSTCRWDESEVTILPEYLRMLYIKTLSNFKEFEDILEPNKKYRMAYTKEAVCAHAYLFYYIYVTFSLKGT